MSGLGFPVKTWNEQIGIDKLDAIVAAKMLTLVVPPVGIGLRIAFAGIDDERSFSLGELAVRHDVDALVAYQPEPWLFALA
ncbi:hypothetical protein FIV05_31330 (plasmid) [Labrenzia sp. THAF191a]|nr:hypothetical protein FIV05_31330 [Labrenzia sp. THAF191a]